MNPQEARRAFKISVTRGADVARVAEGVDALFADQLDGTVQKVAIPISGWRIEDRRWLWMLEDVYGWIVFIYIYIYIILYYTLYIYIRMYLFIYFTLYSTQDGPPFR